MKIYFPGIGGIGLSAYAALQRVHGHEVMGSDRTDSQLLQDLRSQGIGIFLDQSGVHVPEDCDLFVYSEAIPESAPERLRAKELGISQRSYPQALGGLSKGYRVIAVCGTHGKSSTTAMAARMLIAAGKDPTVVVGTKVQDLDGRNWRKGESDLFLLEACEYRHSFLSYDPSIILMTNCDGDHFDFFESKEVYQDSFVDFLQRLPSDGTVITHMNDPDAKIVAQRSGKETTDADAYPMIDLHTPGNHMRQNAQLVLALAEALGIPQEEAKKSVSGYAGSWRRMEKKGEYKGIPVIDDYGHHPKEIAATLAALRELYPTKRIVCVFQPHTHDRTLKLYDDFIRSFRDVGLVIIPNIYDARAHLETTTVDVATLAADIAKSSGTKTIDGHSLSEAEQMLRTEILQDGDVLICMGAGDITNLASNMIEE